MTKEELEKEANKYADNYATPDLDCSFRAYMFEASKEGYLAGAEPREKRIAELEEKLANADYQLEGRDLEIKELEAQIEKMKCGQNCKHSYLYQEDRKCKFTYCDCINCKDKWELRR